MVPGFVQRALKEKFQVLGEATSNDMVKVVSLRD
jgi:hypothetical protein